MFAEFGWRRSYQRRLEERIARLERMLAALLEHLDVVYDDRKAQEQMVSARVRELVRAGRIIDAIKQYRADTGAGLAEAKRMIDSLPRT